MCFQWLWCWKGQCSGSNYTCGFLFRLYPDYDQALNNLGNLLKVSFVEIIDLEITCWVPVLLLLILVYYFRMRTDLWKLSHSCRELLMQGQWTVCVIFSSLCFSPKVSSTCSSSTYFFCRLLFVYLAVLLPLWPPPLHYHHLLLLLLLLLPLLLLLLIFLFSCFVISCVSYFTNSFSLVILLLLPSSTFPPPVTNARYFWYLIVPALIPLPSLCFSHSISFSVLFLAPCHFFLYYMSLLSLLHVSSFSTPCLFFDIKLCTSQDS